MASPKEEKGFTPAEAEERRLLISTRGRRITRFRFTGKLSREEEDMRAELAREERNAKRREG